MSGGEVKIEHVGTVSITVQSSGNWARVVVDVKPRPNGGGAMLAIVSSFGNYGTWFSAPGEDFPRWVAQCDDAYLTNRLRPYGKPTRQQEREVSAFMRTLWPLVRAALRVSDPLIASGCEACGGAEPRGEALWKRGFREAVRQAHMDLVEDREHTTGGERAQKVLARLLEELEDPDGPAPRGELGKAGAT